jgi:hypothetical protein
MKRPEPNEAAPYYSRYIDLVPDGDIVATLSTQLEETEKFLEGISEEQSLSRYAPDKWTIRQVLNHINDTERVFLFRAFWFARGSQEALPGFEQDVYVASSGANDVSWKDLVEEFRVIRQSAIKFFQQLPNDAWSKTGVASENPVSVRALSFILAGHAVHHVNVLKERYL